VTLVSSPDGQWVAARRGRDVVLLAAGHAPPVGQLALDHDDVDLALVGPPVLLVAVSRHADGTTVVLHQPPYLDAVARLDLEAPYQLAAITGPRMALVSKDAKQVTIVRAAGRALSAQAVSVGGPVELSVGLDRNQMLFAILRKLEVWDAVSGRPLLRLQLQLPPPPRTVGAAAGHLWTTRPDSDEIFIYRLSDGRPFRHQAGAPIERVICHPASPILVLVTPRGLVRLHCLAHALTAIDAPWPPPGDPSLAQLVTGDDIQLLGLGDGPEPWRVSITGNQPTVSEPEPAAARPEGDSTLGSMARSRGRNDPAPRAARAPVWRDAVAGYGLELTRGGDAETPVVAVDTELGELAHRLGLSATARRALIAVYGAYLAGERLPIVRIARAVADWNEPLGHGELGALGMIRTRDGRVVLADPVARLLDGFSPRAIRIVDRGKPSASGVVRVDRAGRSDADLESGLADQLGRVAIVIGHVATGLLEARLVGATAIVLRAPAQQPVWLREANVVVIADPGAPAWLAALPELTASSPAPAS
jgi:hypothetical protein